jgi:hypothetical protein
VGEMRKMREMRESGRVREWKSEKMGEWESGK